MVSITKEEIIVILSSGLPKEEKEKILMRRGRTKKEANATRRLVRAQFIRKLTATSKVPKGVSSTISADKFIEIHGGIDKAIGTLDKRTRFIVVLHMSKCPEIGAKVTRKSIDDAIGDLITDWYELLTKSE